MLNYCRRHESINHLLLLLKRQVQFKTKKKSPRSEFNWMRWHCIMWHTYYVVRWLDDGVVIFCNAQIVTSKVGACVLRRCNAKRMRNWHICRGSFLWLGCSIWQRVYRHRVILMKYHTKYIRKGKKRDTTDQCMWKWNVIISPKPVVCVTVCGQAKKLFLKLSQKRTKQSKSWLNDEWSVQTINKRHYFCERLVLHVLASKKCYCSKSLNCSHILLSEIL